MKPALVKRFVDTGQVRFDWHDFAWIGHESRQAAQAARCTGRQGKFWEYHDHLYDNQDRITSANLRAFAGALGLDTAAFGACLEQGADLNAIQQELTTARQQGITATPLFFINGQRLAGAREIDAFAPLIDAALRR